MKRPIIGITCLVDWRNERQGQNETYIQAIRQAGGTPVLLPAVDCDALIRQHAELIDGLLVSGGPDIDPQYFGEPPKPALGGIVPLMDRYEVALIRQVLELDKPLLGICRGEQVLNVVAGGTLHQDIYKAVPGCLKHRQEAPRSFRAHTVRLQPESRLAQILQAEEIGVNTFHHQAVNQVAPGFIASAHAPDGIVEAIESTRHRFVIGVQWHPEGMWNVSDNYAALFAAFVQAAGAGR
jgi:putative glutamine amidotransferase